MLIFLYVILVIFSGQNIQTWIKSTYAQLFLFQLKLGLKAAETACNVSNLFGLTTTNTCTA